MVDAEQVFSARQAAKSLGLSSAMTRRYGAALEEVTGEAIRQHPRDGRQYQQSQLEAMVRAKGFVEANPRLSVTQALHLALGQASEVGLTDPLEQSETTPQALENAFAQALERTLLPELRALREEVAELRRDVAVNQSALPEVKEEPELKTELEAHGIVVLTAIRFERLWARLSGRS